MTSRSKNILPAVVTVASIGVAAGAVFLARKHKGEIKDFMVSNVLEKPASKSSFTDLSQGLERSGMYLAQRADRAADTPDNCEILIHIIGIERWGQNRLEVAMSRHEFEADEYHAYKPPEDSSIQSLRMLLSQTRAKTIDIAQQLHNSPPDDDLAVEHNGLGMLTAKGWLRYLTHHADLESRKLRSGKEGSEITLVTAEASQGD